MSLDDLKRQAKQMTEHGYSYEEAGAALEKLSDFTEDEIDRIMQEAKRRRMD